MKKFSIEHGEIVSAICCKKSLFIFGDLGVSVCIETGGNKFELIYSWNFERIKNGLICENCSNYILTEYELSVIRNAWVLGGINGVRNLLLELKYEEEI